MKPDFRTVKAGGPTLFQERVFAAVSQIPKGQVSTYGAIAKAINCGSSRAIGQALHRCPYGEEIPCHRVISADLTLGGYADNLAPELARKRRLLEKEGVTFDEQGRVTSAVAKLKPTSSKKAPALTLKAKRSTKSQRTRD